MAAGCGTSPGRLHSLEKNGVQVQRERTAINMSRETEFSLSVHYSGSGGLYILKGEDGIFIDPFFSNQKVMKIGSSLIGGGIKGRKKIRSDRRMIDYGISRIEKQTGPLDNQLRAIFSAHGHYDHLMDVPAIFQRLNNKPAVFLSESGFNTCYNVIDTARMILLEEHVTTQDRIGTPIELALANGRIQVYPILADHNPHFKYVKFFSGSQQKPVTYFKDPFGKTRANDWLEGNTFSFIIDYLNKSGEIEFRIFVQSSSCNPMAGVPPADLLAKKAVDVAFLGVVSYHFSPDYPCTLLSEFQNAHPDSNLEIVWMHWEDFFRKYDRKPKTVRGTDVPAFFNIPCVLPYKNKSWTPWPGVVYDISVKSSK
jgi:hypothetical protein